jgi:hypothetical protein
MKQFLILVLTILSCSVFAGSKSYSLNFEVTDSVENLIGKYIDYEHTCMNGCTYQSPSVSEIKILDVGKTADRFFIWISIDDIKDSQSFYRVKITKEGKKTIIAQEQLSKMMGEILEQKTGLPYNPLFKKNEITTVFTQVTPIKAQVNLNIFVSYGILLAPMGRRIQDAIEDISHSIKDNLSK